MYHHTSAHCMHAKGLYQYLQQLLLTGLHPRRVVLACFMTLHVPVTGQCASESCLIVLIILQSRCLHIANLVDLCSSYTCVANMHV